MHTHDTIYDWTCCDTCADAETSDKGGFKESEHPRGQPENAGEFASSSKGSKALQPAHADREQWPAHIQQLRVPPAWTDVHYNHDPEGALQVIGKDAKGRRQPIYHPKFAASQAAAKFARIKELDKRFHVIKNQNEKARLSGDPKVRSHADATALIMRMGIRPGSEENTGAEKQAYGATTLLGHHVVKNGDEVHLKFTGKKGVDLSLPVEDIDLAKMLVNRAKKSGHSGQLFPEVSAGSLLNYVHSLGGNKGFKTKDFRTLLGTRSAMEAMKNVPAPTSASGYKKAVKQVATLVSQKLGNTPTVALQSYINPTVFAEWRQSAGV